MPLPRRPRLSRRQFLVSSTVGLGGLLALRPWLSSGQVETATAVNISPPEGIQVSTDNPIYQSYMDALHEIVASAPPPDRLYALSSETRYNIPLYPDTVGRLQDPNLTLIAPAYTDHLEPISINPRPAVGPTLEFVRGKTTGVYLTNTLQTCGPDPHGTSGWIPHGFTDTNLHTHGLHVTPQAPSDDVLITLASSASIDGGHDADARTDYPYYYKVPADHPVGTFWYHPHKHGAVASQVNPGMSGILIIRDGEAHSDPDQMDFDELLDHYCNITVDDEIPLVLQNINYFPTTDPQTAVFYHEGYYSGSLPSGGVSCFGLDLKKPTVTDPPLSINGLVNPTYDLPQNHIKRLRVLNGTDGGTFVLKMRVKAGTTAAGLPDLYAIAADGIALTPPSSADPNTPFFKIDYDVSETDDPGTYWATGELISIAAGQRLDLLIQAKDVGLFELYGVGIAELADVPSVVESTEQFRSGTVLTFNVTAETDATRRSQSLPTAALFNMPGIQRPDEPVWQGLDAPLPSATQTLEFKTLDAAFTSSGITEPPFLINNQYFDSDLEDKAQIQLFKNNTDVWNLYSSNDAHIFHIHVNSFQIWARVAYDRTTRAYGAPIPYSMPIWRDTVYFDGGPRDETNSADFIPGRMVVFGSKQVDFTGEFVLHCHNLFHEDNGMMLTVSILDPLTGEFDSD